MAGSWVGQSTEATQRAVVWSGWTEAPDQLEADQLKPVVVTEVTANVTRDDVGIAITSGAEPNADAKVTEPVADAPFARAP